MSRGRHQAHGRGLPEREAAAAALGAGGDQAHGRGLPEREAAAAALGAGGDQAHGRGLPDGEAAAAALGAGGDQAHGRGLPDGEAAAAALGAGGDQAHGRGLPDGEAAAAALGAGGDQAHGRGLPDGEAAAAALGAGGDQAHGRGLPDGEAAAAAQRAGGDQAHGRGLPDGEAAAAAQRASGDQAHDPGFFDRDALTVARDLIGIELRRCWQGEWLTAAVVEAEAYYQSERGSHASLGRTPSREPLWMAPGTIYMYYARGGDSLNVSCHGAGNAVLIKAALPTCSGPALAAMRGLNPARGGGARASSDLCRGQTLLCRALALRVPEWNGRPFDHSFHLADTGYRPPALIQAPRLGIPHGRDEHLCYRFVDYARAPHATANPLTRRAWQRGRDYQVLDRQAEPAATTATTTSAEVTCSPG